MRVTDAFWRDSRLQQAAIALVILTFGERDVFHSLSAPQQECFAGALWLNMKNSSKPESEKEPRVPLDDAQFAIVVLAVTSFTLIIFVLGITLWMS